MGNSKKRIVSGLRMKGTSSMLANSSTISTKNRISKFLLTIMISLVMAMGIISGAFGFAKNFGNLTPVSAESGDFYGSALRIGDYIENFGGIKWRVIGLETHNSIV